MFKNVNFCSFAQTQVDLGRLSSRALLISAFLHCVKNYNQILSIRNLKYVSSVVLVLLFWIRNFREFLMNFELSSLWISKKNHILILSVDANLLWNRLVSWKNSQEKKSEEVFLDLGQNIKQNSFWRHLWFIMNDGYSMVSFNFAQIPFRKNWPYKIASGLISDMLQWLTSFPKIFIFHPVSPTIIGRHLGLFWKNLNFTRKTDVRVTRA